MLYNNVLSVTPDSESCAIQYYSLGDDGSLSGEWLSLAEGKSLGTETLIPISSDSESLIDTYDLIGINPDGTEYSGTVEISITEPNYFITWYTEGSLVRQIVGIEQNDVITVGFGEGNCLIYSYIINENGSISSI